MNQYLDHFIEKSVLSAKDTGFSNDMGHELRSPLVTIVALTEALLEDVYGSLADVQRSAVKNIQADARQALTLIADVVELGRLPPPPSSRGQQTCDLVKIAGEAAIHMRDTLQSRSINLDCALFPYQAHVAADAKIIRQMIIKLLSIALETTADGSELQISITTLAVGVRLQIQSNQPSQSSEERPILQSAAFEQWMKLKPIGITLLRILVERYDGRLLIREINQKDVEAIIIELPLQIVPLQGAWGAESITTQKLDHQVSIVSETSSVSRLLLLADDQPMLLAVTRSYLESLGYRVEIAHNGLEAVEMTLRLQPDLIIIDINMPLLDGLGAVARIRSSPLAKNKIVPIICVTGAVEGDIEECLESGATEYLTKPFGIKQIDSLLSKYLGRV